MIFDFRARLTRAYDGDSFWVLADTGFRQRYEPELRLIGVYAPEIKKKQAGALETRDFVDRWFATLDPALKWPLYVVTDQTKVREPSQKTTHDRYLAWVWRYGRHETEPSLNQDVNAYLALHPEWPRGAGA